ncbi:MAG TPA: 3-methyl-2-oxobutanoate hydroxymethyltransferase [Anaerolineales bacterium]|nr:3-methyl-2-oxobutanoate hydroxymethyltransferase [Anaerolineales bacterium]
MSTQPVLSNTSPPNRKKITLHTLRQKKARREMISMLTAYDFFTAQAVDQAGIDIILVGDSLGMVVLGYENTLPVTMDDMLHHAKAVSRGALFALLVGDMPFLSYQISTSEAVRNAGRFLQEAGMDAVKLEGGRERIDAIRAITQAGIPVMGHLGLTPQSVHQFGGFRPQARQSGPAQRLLEDALALQEAGCFSLVLESIPTQLAGLVSQKLEIPTIGIGAGPACDGQVLVIHDLLGLFDRFTPRFAKQYAHLYETMLNAIQAYKEDVEQGNFPAEEHTIEMVEDEWQILLKNLNLDEHA